MRTISRQFLKLAFFQFLFFSSVWGFNQRDPFDIEADRIDYYRADDTLKAIGNVVVIQTSATLKADYVTYQRKTQKLYASGNVQLTEKGSTLQANELIYDLLKEEGQVLGSRSKSGDWHVQSSTWTRVGDYYLGENGVLTTCSLPVPHYSVHSSRLNLLPHHHFWAWNNLARLDGLPIFYTPFLYKNFESRRVVFQIRPGHSDVNGATVKTITTIRYSENAYQRVYLDHYSKQGQGIGSEFNYWTPNQLKGSFFGYYIDPTGDPSANGAPTTPQYNLRLYHWQKLSPTWLIQSNANLRNNISFNNRYFPQDTNQSVNDLLSSIALTQQTQFYNQRLVFERLDSPAESDRNQPFAATRVQRASLPRYDFSFFQRPLWKSENKTTSVGPVLYTVSGGLGNTYARETKNTQLNANLKGTLTQTYLLSRKLSLTPTISPDIRWQDRFDPSIVASTDSLSTVNGFRGVQLRSVSSAALRYKLTSALSLDQVYRITHRFTPNQFQLDRSRSDEGIETHSLSWLLYYRPSRLWLYRSFTSYDIRHVQSETLAAHRERKWAPWGNEVTWKPHELFEFFARYQNDFYPTRVILWEIASRAKLPLQTEIETSLLYNRSVPGKITWNQRLYLYMSPAWRVDMTLRSFVNGLSGDSLSQSRMIQSEFRVVRTLHCWEVEFTYRNRPPVLREYAFFINLRLGQNQTVEGDIPNKTLESEFYPWRNDSHF